MRMSCCALALVATPAMAGTAEQFATEAVGYWSSAEQSASADYNYVWSETTRILPERDDGVWLFQQNRIMGPNSDEAPADPSSVLPYFQIIIQVRDLGDGALHTTSYRIAGAEARLGAMSISPTSEAGFDSDWIGEVACMGRMQKVGEGFWEASASCPNGYKGGVKVESRSVRAPGYYVNWDRGFNIEGAHIWGPAGGGYIFKKEGEGE